MSNFFTIGEPWGKIFDFFYFLTNQKLFLWVPKKVKKNYFIIHHRRGGVKGGLTNIKFFFEGFHEIF